jgi:hypothetical protein
MDKETVRKKLIISGYEHPTDTNTDRNNKYKTFSEGEKKKKNMNKFKSMSVGKQYATREITVNTETCPKCKKEPVYTCPCAYSDKKCINDHIWHTDREGKSKLGNPH